MSAQNKIEISFAPSVSHAIYIGAPVNWENCAESRLATVNFEEMPEFSDLPANYPGELARD